MLATDIEREIILPKSKEEWLALRIKDITSTEVSALFGISPYTTLFSLWHDKKEGVATAIEENERMKWGTRLQDAIADGIANDEGWSIRCMEEYIRIPSLRMASSFDFSIYAPGGCFEHSLGGSITRSPMTHGILPIQIKSKLVGVEDGILEIKNIDSLQFKDGWISTDVGLEAPPHIELQVQHQMLVSGRSYTYIGGLVGGNKVHLIRREPDIDIFAAITRRVAEFWASIDANEPPAPDFARDAKTIARLHNFAEPGKIFDAKQDSKISGLMNHYRIASEIMKKQTEIKDSVKAEILTMIGDAEKVIGDGFSISAGVQGPVHIEAYERAGFRQFKPYFKKTKGV